jgi:hypothetical protein
MYMGTVHGLGREAASAGQLYAKLTGRPYRGWEDSNELTTSMHDVVVCTTARLSVRLMHRMYVGGDRRGAPGLLFASSPAELEKVCRRQAEKLSRPSTQASMRVFLYSTLDFDRIDRGTDLIIGGNQSSKGVLAALSAGAAVLTITGHSDGIDLSLSSRQFACPFLVSPPRFGQLLPYCQIVRRCTRFPAWPTIADAERAGWIVPLTAIRANIGVIFSCNVVRLPDGIIDADCGLAATLLGQADFGVIVTTWRRERFGADGATANGLINTLCSGTMAGIAVHNFNTSPLAAKLGTSLCVVGDPCFRLQSPTAFDVLPEIRVVPPTTRPPEPRKYRNNPEITLLQDVIRHAIHSRSNLDATGAAKGHALAKALAEHAEIATRWSSSEWQSELAKLDAALFDFLSATSDLDAFFERFGLDVGNSEDDQCPSCLAPARSLWLTFPKRGANPRRIVRCARCGDIIDVPSDWRLALNLSQLNDRIVAVSGIPDGALARLCIASLVHTRAPTSTNAHEASASATPRAGGVSFQLPKTLPGGPLICRILVVHHLKIGSIAFKLRAQADGSLISVLTERSAVEQD